MVPTTSRIRVQCYLSQAGATSRRQAEVLIGEGRVAVNGDPVEEMDVRVVPRQDVVAVDGRVVGRRPVAGSSCTSLSGFSARGATPMGAQPV